MAEGNQVRRWDVASMQAGSIPARHPTYGKFLDPCIVLSQMVECFQHQTKEKHDKT